MTKVRFHIATWLTVFLCTTILSCSAGSDGKGPDPNSKKKIEQYSVPGPEKTAEKISLLAEGEQDTPAEYRLKISGTIHHTDWESIESSLSAKKNVLVFLDFSNCKVGSNSEDRKTGGNIFKCIDSLSGIEFPEGLTEIGYYSFIECKNLRSVYFPRTTACAIGRNCFNRCPSLDDVHLYAVAGSLEGFCESCGDISLLEVPEEPIYLEQDTSSFDFPFDSSNVKEVRTPTRTLTFDQWEAECSVLTPIPVKFKSVQASSRAAEKYGAGNICDGTWASWVEGKSDEGIGETIELEFEKPSTVDFMVFKNGFGNLAYYYSNNRIKDIAIMFDDDPATEATYTLNDTPLAQYIYLREYRIHHSVTLTIKSVYRGTGPDNDTCLDEFLINQELETSTAYEDDGTIYARKQFRYDPETARMLKAMHELDAGPDNLRTAADGRVQIHVTDYERKETRWQFIDYDFDDHFSSCYYENASDKPCEIRYKVFFFPDGRHILFIWNEIRSFSSKPETNLRMYVWENRTWKFMKAGQGEASIAHISAFMQELQRRSLPYRFEVTYNWEAVVEPYVGLGGRWFSVSCSFPYGETEFAPYAKTPSTIAAFGTPEELEAFPNWKEELSGIQKTEYGNTYDENLLAYAAAFNKSPEMTQFLIDQGGDVNPEYPQDNTAPLTPLEAWKAGGNTEEIRTVLLKANAKYPSTLLINAFYAHNTDEFENLSRLVNNYTDLYPIIIRYCMHENENKREMKYVQQILTILKNNGCDLNKAYDDGAHAPQTLVSDAVQNHLSRLFGLLIEAGCTIPEKICDNGIVYQAAYEYLENDKRTKSNAYEILLRLMDEGADVNGTNKNGNTALHLACRSGTTQNGGLTLAGLCVKHGGLIDAKNNFGETPLVLLVSDEDGYTNDTIQTARFLLEHGADVNSADTEGNSVLHTLCDNAHRTDEDYDCDDTASDSGVHVTNLFNLVLSHGAAVNAKNNDGRTPLFLLLEGEIPPESVKMVRLLVTSGADCTATDNDGYPIFIKLCESLSAMQVPFEEKKSLYKLFLNHGADINVKDSYNGTPLSRFWLKCGLFDNEERENGSTEGNGHKLAELLPVMIEDGADVTAVVKVFLSDYKEHNACPAEMLLNGAYNYSINHPGEAWTADDKQIVDTFIQVAVAVRAHGGKKIVSDKRLKKSKVSRDVISLIHDAEQNR